ncbi:hypothetical protein WH7805_13888 [Synechococcus sp. WH 7805]|nr:hypothetical protein WH7805_13888 [Synechococcus sp. WH 7805]
MSGQFLHNPLSLGAINANKIQDDNNSGQDSQ